MPKWLERQAKRQAKRAIRSRRDIKGPYKTVDEARNAYAAEIMHKAGYWQHGKGSKGAR